MINTDGEIKGMVIVHYKTWNKSASVMNYEHELISMELQ